MTDQELLERAARAVGAINTHSWSDKFAVQFPGDQELKLWNPLDYDGDALRLANACMLCVEISEDDGGCTRILDEFGDVVVRNMHDHSGVDAATRRAIVQAAALAHDKQEGSA